MNRRDKFPPRRLRARLASAASLAAIAGAAALLFSNAADVGAQAGPCEPPNGNPVMCENQNTGNLPGEWDVDGAGDTTIQGYATDISVNVGQVVHFKINTDASLYRVDIYRLGYYGGMGARKVATVAASVPLPQSQPSCLSDSATGLVDCGNWKESASWSVPATAASGIYLARPTRTDSGGASHIMFVVRNDSRHSDLLFQTADTTWQAYNTYGGNSLYRGAPAGRAYKVSYNRPMVTRGNEYRRASFFGGEYPMVRWLEANGYDVSYATGVDTDRRGNALLDHRAFLSVGHDEYWSAAQRTNVEVARAAGVNLAFFSGNEMFWKTRWEASIDGSGTAYRTLVSYKETLDNAKTDPLPNVWTGTWRDRRFSPSADGGRPENAVTGTIFTANCCTQDAIGVSTEQGKLRFWRNTSLAQLEAGQIVSVAPGLVGYESDEDLDNGVRPAGLIRLSANTRSIPSRLLDYGGTYGPGVATHSLTLYRHASGALVFGAGLTRWAWALDTAHDFDPATPDVPTAPVVVIQQATVNLLADMSAQPLTLQPGLIATSANADTIAPTSIITAPVANATVPAGAITSIRGTATDAGGGIVAAVEVSVDGGATWHRATGTSAWTYSWLPPSPGTYLLKARASDDSGLLEIPVGNSAVTVTPASCPCTIWDSSETPAVAASSDTAAVTLGVKLRTDRPGFISGLRFYKGAGNTGTHTGALWTSTGTLIASLTFTSETATGWQTASFNQPVAIAANTTYVASYYAPAGRYSSSGAYFADTGVDRTPLHALSTTSAAGNGVYVYGAGGFPASSYNATNYWVDVVFTTAIVADTTPPAITGVDAAATNDSAMLTWTTDEAASSRVEYGLTPGALTSSGTAGGLITSHAVAVPGLAANTTYYYQVTSVDAAGNAATMPAPPAVFTTTAPGALNCPCVIWPTQVPNQPAAQDASAVELGLKFRSTVSGFVSSIRFYKSAANVGTHVGNLWSMAGANLGTVLFQNETASGWQQASLASPVAIAANTTYIVSYHTNTGFYAGDGGFFNGTGVVNGPLQALANGIDGTNGVYKYGPTAWPTDSYNASNYWVDVVFGASAPTIDTTPPSVSATTPVHGSTGQSVTVAIAASFSEDINPATITAATIELRDGSSVLVPAAIAYNPSTRTASLQASAPLATASTYTARVRGGAGSITDLAGNALAADRVWSFTTVAEAGLSLSDTTAADFSAGALDAGTYIAQTGDGEVQLRPAIATEFYGSAMPSGWSNAPWSTGGTAALTGSSIAVDGSRFGFDGLVGPGQSLEFVATFTSDAAAHVGFGVDFDQAPWAIFSSSNGSGLYARTNDGTTATNTPIAGNWFGSAHRYRIDWTGTSVAYFIDQVQVAVQPTAIAAMMRPMISDYTVGGTMLNVDWLRSTPYATVGTFTSRVIDGGGSSDWSAGFSAIIPAPTNLAVVARFGNTAVPDGTWTGFQSVTAVTAATGQRSRYAQYQASFTGSGTSTPTLQDVTFSTAAAPPVSLSIGNVAVIEGNSGSQDAAFIVAVSPVAAAPVTVAYTTANGTATAGSDYTAVSGTLTIPAGAASATLNVPVAGDTLLEASEAFFVNLSAPTNATIANPQGTATITDDDAAVLSIGNASITEGNALAVTANFAVTLSPASGQTVTVAYTTRSGTAGTSDFTARSGTLTFAAGVTAQSIAVSTLGDTLDEDNETFTVDLSGPVNAAIGIAQGTGTITDNDAAPSLLINDVTITEGEGGTANATFTVSLSAVSGRTVTLAFATANVSAIAPADYATTSGSLSLTAGAMSRTIVVPVVGDLFDEANETFNVNLSGAVNATIADSRGVGTIADNDATPSLTIGDASVSEGKTGSRTMTFTLTLSAASGQTVRVTYATADGTATGGTATSDYVTKSGTVTFAAGTTSVPVTVSVRGDAVAEANETFLVNLTDPVNVTIADTQGTGTILNDD